MSGRMQMRDAASGEDHGCAYYSDDKLPVRGEEEGMAAAPSRDEDLWADCFSVESEDLLNLNDDYGGGFDEDLGGGIPAGQEVSFMEVAQGLFEETTHQHQTESETQQSMPMPDEVPVISVPPVSRETHQFMPMPDQVPTISIPPVSRTILPPPEANEIDAVGLPVFTAEEQMAEIASLTPPEINGALSDLHGITAAIANLEIQPPRPAVLSRLEDELYKLPDERKLAYCQAVIKCPGLVDDKRKMAFLERENGDPALAAARLALHWELRLEIFGPERCFLPMTLNGAMKDEVINMVRWPIHQLLPVKDTAGRAIWYFDPSRRDFDSYSVDQEHRALWYMFEVAMEDPEVLKHGLVMITNCKDAEPKHFFPKDKTAKHMTKRLLLILQQAIPIHLRAGHHCHLSIIVSFLVPVFLSLFGRHYRTRTQIHRGSEAEVLRKLEEFCLPKDCLPTELGGKLVLNITAFLAQRMSLENSRPDPRLVLDQKPISVLQGPAAKRMRSEPAAVETNFRSRGKADPRMNQAVKIKLADPNLSLEDVLLEAGYTFDFQNEKGEAVDGDNITLKQRKNNLCRRVLREKKKWEENDEVLPEQEKSGSLSDEAQRASPDSSPEEETLPETDVIIEAAVAETNSRPKGKADPRMNKAVKIRLAEPNAPLEDVLLEAGYTFDFQNEKGEAVDGDNITLQQRKNNLCRRVLREKKKREANNFSRPEEPQQDSTTSKSSAVGSGDDFYDAILELPGIEEAELSTVMKAFY